MARARQIHRRRRNDATTTSPSVVGHCYIAVHVRSLQEYRRDEERVFGVLHTCEALHLHACMMQLLTISTIYLINWMHTF
jgi:hypothetical protein